MEPAHLSDQLKALAASSSKRSKTARLKELMPDIDQAMQKGVPRSEILELLSASGFEMTMNYFDVARRRIKKEQLGKIDKAALSTQGARGNSELPVDSLRSQKPVLNTTVSNNPVSIEALVSNKPAETSARRFRGQFVDLDALSKLVPKKKP
jgi:hypothetical protein